MRLRRYILAGFSGFLIVLAFPGINMSAVAWFALAPLLVSIHDADWKHSLWLGFLAGMIYLGGTLNWFMALGPFSSYFWVILGLLALVIYLSTYVFIFTVSVNFVTRYWILDTRCWILDAGLFIRIQNPVSRIQYPVTVAVVWTGLEILRGYVATGFPWAGLSHTQWSNLPLIQISSITGMYGVTFLITLINGTIANFIINIHRWRSALKAAIIPFALLIMVLIYGWVALSGSPGGEKMKVALVPGNIRQMEKLMSWGSADWIFDKYVSITDRVAAEKPHLIVWPETSVPRFMFQWDSVPKDLETLVRKWNAYFLTGTPYREVYPEIKSYNAAFLISPEGKIVDRYYKVHLVPVGEYFPMKRYLPESWQKAVTGVSDWDAGNSFTIFSAPPARFGVAICFESIFPAIFRKFANQGVDSIGIITNDAWFEGTYAPEQHYSMAPFRAVENRMGIFRCANHGVSCIIDPWGRVIQKMRPGDPVDYLVGDVYLRSGGSFYTRYGDYLPWACLATTLLLSFHAWWRARKT